MALLCVAWHTGAAGTHSAKSFLPSPLPCSKYVARIVPAFYSTPSTLYTKFGECQRVNHTPLPFAVRCWLGRLLGLAC